MLRYLSSLVLGRGKQTDRLDPALLDQAVERVVDGTDPRLRLVSGYRKRLRRVVEGAGLHVIGLVDGLPEPAALERRGYTADPRLRAFFAAPDRIPEVVGESPALQDYLRHNPDPRAPAVFGLLTMEWAERRVLGMELTGDRVQREVVQVVVEFAHHRFVAVSGSETETRREIKLRAFDYLIQRALGRLAGERERKGQLQRQQQLLRRKLDALRAGHWGLEPVLAEPTATPDLAALETELGRIEADLLALGTPAEHLEKALDTVSDTLGQAADLIDTREVRLRLDQMNVLVPESASGNTAQLELDAVVSATGERRILLLSRVPRDELPGRPDLVDTAMRFLT